MSSFCLHCNNENAAGVALCFECGRLLPRLCSECGFENVVKAKFCGSCGVSLVRNTGLRPPASAVSPPLSAAVSASARTAVRGERRQLTVMFCDLVGSTLLADQLDPEDLQSVLSAYQNTSAQAIRTYEGHIAKYLGDGLVIFFGYPLVSTRFDFQSLGAHRLRGIAGPIDVFQVDGLLDGEPTG